MKGENSNSLLKTYEKLIVDIDKKNQAAIGGWLRMASNSRISSGRELLSSQRMGIIFAAESAGVDIPDEIINDKKIIRSIGDIEVYYPKKSSEFPKYYRPYYNESVNGNEEDFIKSKCPNGVKRVALFNHEILVDLYALVGGDN